MSFLTTEDGTRIFYKDLGDSDAPPIVLCHGWPLSSDAWDGQIVPLLDAGFRVVAHDRRGHGRSDHTSAGNDMDTYADDLAELMNELGLRDAVMVGHSTGGGEVARYIGRHGSDRVAKVVLLSAVPPIMVSTDAWPDGTDRSVFDGIRKGVLDNRSQFYLDLAVPFFGMNRPDAKLNEGWRLSFWQQGMLGSIVGQHACVREFSEVDYTKDLEAIDVPTLIIHGDDDQIVPIAHAGALSAKVVKDARFVVYEGGSHGLASTHKDRLNADLIRFAGR
jgi:non-heme chloroperoxidase